MAYISSIDLHLKKTILIRYKYSHQHSISVSLNFTRIKYEKGTEYTKSESLHGLKYVFFRKNQKFGFECLSKY